MNTEQIDKLSNPDIFEIRAVWFDETNHAESCSLENEEFEIKRFERKPDVYGVYVRHDDGRWLHVLDFTCGGN